MQTRGVIALSILGAGVLWFGGFIFTQTDTDHGMRTCGINTPTVQLLSDGNIYIETATTWCGQWGVEKLIPIHESDTEALSFTDRLRCDVHETHSYPTFGLSRLVGISDDMVSWRGETCTKST